MPSLKAGGDNYFLWDDEPKNRGLYQVKWNDGNGTVSIEHAFDQSQSLTNGYVDITSITDGTSSYADKAALITALNSFFF